MSRPRTQAVKYPRFGELLSAAICSIAHHEHVTIGNIDVELGKRCHLESSTVERWKGGKAQPPEAEHVRILAEAAVKRGRMNWVWLEEFLSITKYVDREGLIEELYPNLHLLSTRRVHHQLVHPTYSRFVDRQQEIDVIKGLSQRTALVVIQGAAGLGKSSLMREIVGRCVHGESGLPKFDAFVWITSPPGNMTRAMLVSEIARKLDHSGMTGDDEQQLLHKIEHVLATESVLIAIDQFERITDSTALEWLLQLPFPSKAIVATRTHSSDFQYGGYIVNLASMNRDESLAFLRQRLEQFGMTHYLDRLDEFTPLLQAANGSPQLIAMALGTIMSNSEKTLPEIIEDLTVQGGIHDILTRWWIELDLPSRQVLVALSLYHGSASSDALRETVGLDSTTYEQTVAGLTVRAFIENQRPNLTVAPRYSLHPMVRPFVDEQRGRDSGFVHEARAHQVAWYIKLVKKAADPLPWDNVKQLTILEPEEDNLIPIAIWCQQHERYCDALRIAAGAGYYYYLSGAWDKLLQIDLLRISCARSLPDAREEALAIAYFIQILAKQGKIQEDNDYLKRLLWLMKFTVDLGIEKAFHCHHAVGLCYIAQGNYRAAEREYRDYGHQLTTNEDQYTVALNNRWLATCLYLQQRYDEADSCALEALKQASQLSIQQCIVDSQVLLAAISLEQGNLDRAHSFLSESQRSAHEFRHRSALGDIYWHFARYYQQRGDPVNSRKSLFAAIEEFERTNRPHELGVARDTLRTDNQSQV